MKNASLQSDLRRDNFNPSINARLLWLAGLIAIFVFVLWPNAGPAYAADLIYSMGDGSNHGYTTIPINTTYDFNSLITFTPDVDGQITEIQRRNYWDGWGTTSNNWQFVLLDASGSVLSYSDTCPIDMGFYYDNTPCAWSDNPIIYNGTNYYISIRNNANPANSNVFGNGDQTVFALKIYGNTDLVPPVSIAIDFPPNATSTPDFSLWSVSGYASSTGDTIQILSQATSSNTWIIDGGRYLGDPGLFSDFMIVKNTAAVPDIYRAYAILYHGLDIEATSSIITYTITGQNPGTGGYYGEFGYYPDTYPTSTASSSEWVITCDPNDSLWNKSLCQIAKWTLDGINALAKFLFMPKSSDFDQFSNLKTALENKPPMGYFYAIKDALTFNSTTTKAFDLASSTVAMATPIFDPLKSGLTFILWLLFAFWLFNRIKHFNL